MPYKKKTKLNKNFVAIIFAMFCFVSVFPLMQSSLNFLVNASIEIGIADNYKSNLKSSKLYGDGSLNKPFEVYTLNDLYLIEYNINTLNLTSFVNGHYTLMNNINCQGYALKPIGYKNTFEGVFNGNGYSISNFNIFFNGSVSYDSLYLGIFGQNKGTIKNLTIDSNLSINLTDRYASNVYIGGICGQNGGTIESCTKDSYLEVYTVGSENTTVTVNIGGICGVTNKELKNCINNGDILGKKTTVSEKDSTGVTYSIGGISGSSDEDFTYCYNHGNISCEVVKDSYLGGIVGIAPAPINIACCYSTKTINCIDANNVCYTGGIIARAKENLTIENCFNEGDVLSGDFDTLLCKEAYSGGLIGRCAGTLYIKNSYNIGDTSAFAIDDNTVNPVKAYSGGLAGHLDSSSITINSSYSVGNFDGNGESRESLNQSFTVNENSNYKYTLNGFYSNTSYNNALIGYSLYVPQDDSVYYLVDHDFAKPELQNRHHIRAFFTFTHSNKKTSTELFKVKYGGTGGNFYDTSKFYVDGTERTTNQGFKHYNLSGDALNANYLRGIRKVEFDTFYIDIADLQCTFQYYDGAIGTQLWYNQGITLWNSISYAGTGLAKSLSEIKQYNSLGDGFIYQTGELPKIKALNW